MDQVLSPEGLYGWSMRIFVAGILSSCVMTFGFVKPDLSQDPIITVYGAVNVCISFDYSPAKEFMAVVWQVVTAGLTLHVYLFLIRVRQHYDKTSTIVWLGYICGAIFALSAAAMGVVFLIGPSRSVIGHTVPYQAFIVGCVVWTLYNLAVIETWPPGLAKGVIVWWRGFTAVFLTVSAIKIYIQWVLMLTHFGTLKKGEYYVPAGFHRQIPDIIWMTQFLFYRLWHPLSHHAIAITMSSTGPLVMDGPVAVPTSESGFEKESTANICCYEIKADGRGCL